MYYEVRVFFPLLGIGKARRGKARHRLFAGPGRGGINHHMEKGKGHAVKFYGTLRKGPLRPWPDQTPKSSTLGGTEIPAYSSSGIYLRYLTLVDDTPC